MRLNDQQIKDLVNTSNIINPYDEHLLQSHSYDCTLNDTIKVQLEEKGSWQTISLKKPYILWPGEFILASTIEVLSMPEDIEGYVQGKSSLGREGLQIECAGFIDPLFHGEITLEIFNMSRWKFVLTHKMPIAQLLFTNVTPAQIKPYDVVGKYNGQTGPTESRA